MRGSSCHGSRFTVYAPSSHPIDAAFKVVGGAFGVACVELLVACEELSVAAFGGGKRLVRYLLQVTLALPDVARREAPVVAVQLVQARQAVGGDAPRPVHIGFEV